MASTTVYPNGDGTINGWTEWAPSTGGTTNLYQKIDEGTASPNDSDSVIGGYAAGSYYILLGDMPVDFGTATAVSIKVRAQYTTGKGDVKSFDCRLVKSDETTAITASTNTTVTASAATYTIPPSITGATDKTSWDGMRLKLTPVASAGTPGSNGGIIVSAVQVDITYTAAAASGGPNRMLSLSNKAFSNINNSMVVPFHLPS